MQMLPFVLFFMLGIDQPKEIASYATDTDCTAALTLVRTAVNETRPLKHFCLPRDQFYQLQMLMQSENGALDQGE